MSAGAVIAVVVIVVAVVVVVLIFEGAPPRVWSAVLGSARGRTPT